jgi:MFS transporter, DHA2 family, multidrug resistance protein
MKNPITIARSLQQSTRAKDDARHDHHAEIVLVSAPAAVAQPLRGLNLVLSTIAVAAANFMNVLDSTIAGVAVPAVASGLAATPSQGTWVITSYGVCLAVVLPLTDWISRRYGEVRVFIVALFLFTLLSWLCAAARSFELLILFRALQGFSGGLLLPLSQTLLLRIYPGRHGLAVAVWSMTSSVAPVLGPLVGGYLTDNFGWPWIFYINVPVGIFACYIVWANLKPYESATVKLPVDAVGMILLIVGVVCLQLGLDRGHELDWFASNQVRILFGLSTVALAAFLCWERYEPHPVIDFSVFRCRTFITGSSLIALMYLTMMLSQVVYPIWLETVMGYTATWAGLVMAPTMLGPFLVLPVLGPLFHKVRDARLLMVVGGLIYTFGLVLHAQSNTEISASHVVAIRILFGFGMPIFWMPLMTVAMSALPPDKTTAGTGIFNFQRMLASSLGVAAGISLWDYRTIFHNSRLTEHLDPNQPNVAAMLNLVEQHTGAGDSAWSVIEMITRLQANTLAMTDVMTACFYMMAVVTLLTLLMPGRAAGAAGHTTPKAME